MAKIDYEQYLVRQTTNQVTVYANNENIRAMCLLSDAQVPDSNHCIEVAWITALPRPGFSPGEHTHDCDEIVLYWGSDFQAPQVLGGEIEYIIGGQPITFNTTTAFYIPKGTPHGPATWKKYIAPHMRMSMMLGMGEYIVHDSKSAVKKKAFDYEQYAARSPMREAGAEFIKGRPSPTMTYMSGVQVPGVKYYIEFGWTFDMPVSRTAGAGMPEMAHNNYDGIVLHIGGDPASPEELGGEVEFCVGGQPLTFATTSALFIPRGLRHGPLRLKEYRQPHIVMAIMCGAGTLKEGWGDSFVTKPENQPEK